MTTDEPVTSAGFTPDGLQLVVASGSGARLWDIKSNQALPHRLKHNGVVNYAEFSPDGQRLLTYSSDKSARRWQGLTGQLLTEPLRHEARVTYAEFSPDGQWIMTCSGQNTVRLWDGHQGRCLTEPRQIGEYLLNARFSTDGMGVAVWSISRLQEMKVETWEIGLHAMLAEALSYAGGSAQASFSPDGNQFVAATDENAACVWDVRTGKPVIPQLRQSAAVTAVQFSPNGRCMVTGSLDMTARLWDSASGKPMAAPLTQEAVLWSVTFSPDGQRVATACASAGRIGGYARVWDVHSGQPLTKPLSIESGTETTGLGSKRVAAAPQGTSWQGASGAAAAEENNDALAMEGRIADDGRCWLLRGVCPRVAQTSVSSDSENMRFCGADPL